jgi:hypothetical protein
MMSVRAAMFGIAVLFAAPAIATAAEENPVQAGPFPVLPCAGAPSPAYPVVGDTPNVRVWREADLKGWKTPECAGFKKIEPNTLMATAGRFKSDNVDTIAARLAAISTLTSVRYHASRDESWKNLYSGAHAVADDTGDTRRADFSAADITTDRTLRYWQEENSLLSGITYRLKIVERTDDRLVYTIVNESPAKALLMTVSDPGEFRQYYALEREDGDTWRYYSMVEARIGGPAPASRSFQSRAIAYYRHLTGYPTEMAFRTAP